jgi:[calcium/calmodulin-dependent protein kinase] kinase
VDELLGEGNFAVVYLCRSRDNDEDGRKFAVKILNKERLQKKVTFTGRHTSHSALDKVAVEIALLKKLDHPNLIRLHEVIDGRSDPELFILMEFADGGKVMDWDDDSKTFSSMHGDIDGHYSESHAASLVTDVLHGLDYLHHQHICHRDIKCDNVLLVHGAERTYSAKLSDFGVAHHFEEDESAVVTNTEGTYSFWAPEICSGAGFDLYRADVWAVGVLTFCLIFGKLPFNADDTPSLFEEIKVCRP